jgi:hypothetical protein
MFSVNIFKGQPVCGSRHVDIENIGSSLLFTMEAPISSSDPVPSTPLYDVEGIVDSKVAKGSLYYLVHWKGYSEADRTWEPAENLDHITGLIQQYQERVKQRIIDRIHSQDLST